MRKWQRPGRLKQNPIVPKWVRQEDAAVDSNYDNVIAEATTLLSNAILENEPRLRERATTLDSDVKELLRRVGLGVMADVFRALAEELTAENESQGLKVNRKKKITYSVVFGEVEVESPYHWDRETKRSARPVKDVLGLRHRGRSVGVERALSDFGNEESFGHASVRFAEHYGWEVDRTTVLRVVEQRAQEAETYVQERLARAREDFDEPLATRPGADELLAELDGCEIRTGTLVPARNHKRTEVLKLPCRKRVTAWRDVRVGLAGPVTAPDERTYVASMSDYPRVVGQLFNAACDQNLSSRTQVTAVADGGNGLREELEAQFPGLRFILDQPHLLEHLYEVADAQGLKNEARESWVSQTLARLDKGGAQDVLQDLRKYKGRGKKRTERFVKHLTRFADAVHYEAVREAGLPQGSGEVESCHRWLPQKRLKLPGAWWRPDMVNPMLALRVVRANDWWGDFWQERVSQAAA
jgi:hypothetical protein